MQMDLIMIIGLAAVFVMLINLYQVVSLKSKMSGGLVGKSWNLMILLVVLFAAGYSILPFLATLPVETLRPDRCFQGKGLGGRRNGGRR